MTDSPTEGTTSETRRAWLPIAACPLGIVVGRSVGKYMFAALASSPAHVVRGSLSDNIIWGGVYGGVGALIVALMVRSKLPWLTPSIAIAVSVIGGALFAAMLLLKGEWVPGL